MPELPEVETIKNFLKKDLKNRKILNIKILNSKSFIGNPELIVDSQIKDIRRFGKVTSIDFENGYSLLIHLKLTGQLLIDKPVTKHTRVVINLDNNKALIFNDLRIFGWMKVSKSSEIEKEKFIKSLGKDALEISFSGFTKLLSSRRNIKTLLMDQTKISGIGNIYVNDALWEAKINPKRIANSLQPTEQKKLYDAIHNVLKMGLKYGGASDQDYIKPDGSEGEYQKHFLVYGKQKQPCSRCGNLIEKFFLGGRGTYWCKICQK